MPQPERDHGLIYPMMQQVHALRDDEDRRWQFSRQEVPHSKTPRMPHIGRFVFNPARTQSTAEPLTFVLENGAPRKAVARQTHTNTVGTEQAS
jgi:hypothetical protein